MKRILREDRLRGHTGLLLGLVMLIVVSGSASAQKLRFTSGYKEFGPPADSSLRIGPFYSSLRFTQSVGYRYSESGTNIVDILDGARLGEIKGDGSEFPMISTLTMRNYVIISKNADLDASVSARYEYYPLDTQEDQFSVNLAEEQIMADFTYAIGYQARMTPYLRAKMYVRPSYMTAYVDPTGREDKYGGRRYERVENVLGVDVDYLMKSDMNLALTGQRQDILPQEGVFNSQRSVQYSGSAAWEYQVNTRLMVGLGSTYSTADYPESDSPTYDQMGFSAFSSFDLTKNTRGSASAGYSVGRTAVTSSVPGEEESGTIVGALGLENDLAKDVTHAVEYTRSQARGFERGIEATDHFGYNIGWKGYAGAVSFDTAYDVAHVTAGAVSGYSDARIGLGASWLVVRDVLLSAETSYSVRRNGTVLVEDGVDPAESDDYSTWASQVTAAKQLMKDVTSRVYVQWATRTGNASELDYSRWAVGADCAYSYEF